jgi:hypothetical protein
LNRSAFFHKLSVSLLETTNLNWTSQCSEKKKLCLYLPVAQPFPSYYSSERPASAKCGAEKQVQKNESREKRDRKTDRKITVADNANGCG